MTTTASNVRVGVSGEVYLADAGTASPTDATTALTAAFVAQGYNTDDGITEQIGESWAQINAWQNSDIVRKVRTTHDVMYSFTLMETSEVTLQTFYGDYAAGKVRLRGDTETRGAWVIEVLDGPDVVRIAIPDGEITERGDVQYVNGNAVAYPVTITCYPDVNGDKAIKHYGAFAGA